MITTADFKTGLIINYNNDLYTITYFQHVKPGKGGAFVRTKLKSLTTGRTLENTFNAGAKVQEANIERSESQYSYQDGDTYVFMKLDGSYDEVHIDQNMIKHPCLLCDGIKVYLIYHRESNKYIDVEFPTTVEMTIAEVVPAVKGNTVKEATKEATTETGLKLQVPLFIEEGEKIIVDTRDLSYKERVKK